MVDHGSNSCLCCSSDCNDLQHGSSGRCQHVEGLPDVSFKPGNAHPTTCQDAAAPAATDAVAAKGVVLSWLGTRAKIANSCMVVIAEGYSGQVAVTPAATEAVAANASGISVDAAAMKVEILIQLRLEPSSHESSESKIIRSRSMTQDTAVVSIQTLLGGSWVVISWVISKVTILITHIGNYNPAYNYP